MNRPGTLITTATAWVGVVAGHLAACFLAFPNDGARHIHLEAAGHGWIRVAAPSLLAVVPVILLVVGVGAVRRQPPPSGGGLALRLALIQIPAFVLIELLLQSGSLSRTLSDPAVFIGLVLQPLVAVVSAWILELFRRAVSSAVARLRRSRPVAPRSLPRPALEQVPHRFWLFLPARRRAPPLRLAV